MLVDCSGILKGRLTTKFC